MTTEKLEVSEILSFARSMLPADQREFNIEQWFAGWIKVPQPSLGGHRPEELLDTPTGRRLVKRVIGAMGSGAYL